MSILSFKDSYDINTTTGNSIGVIEIYGAIQDSKQILENLIHFSENDDIKSIVVRIDSPGGAVGPSQEIYTEIERISNNGKPVVASIGAVGASGAYYAAIGADKIVASSGSIIGSIGAISYITNLSELLSTIKVKTTVIKSGQYKDIGSPFKEPSKDHKDLFQNLVNDIKTIFAEDISKSRNLKIEEVNKLADGRVFTGRMALKLGLIDKIGNFNDAISLAKNLGGIVSKPNIIYPKQNMDKWFKMFFEKAESILSLNSYLHIF